MVETVYLHLEFKTKKGNWSINLPFLCDKCGVCCTLDDFLTAGEIHNEPEHPEVNAKMESLKEELGRLFEEDEEKYDQYITSTPCPFKVGSVCSIYELRPNGCRQFPNTPFGMLSTDCAALDRFKKQRSALKKGRLAKETYHFTAEPIRPVKLSEERFQDCKDKLCRAGMTDEEQALLLAFNNRNQSGTVVGQSSISGNGIFAARSFKKDEIVIRWDPHKTISKQEAENLPAEEKEHLSYVEDQYVLVPPNGRVNHSCDPNLLLEDFCYFAKRDIKNGEELTADYRKESEKGFTMKCNCRSKNCKGTIEV